MVDLLSRGVAGGGVSRHIKVIIAVRVKGYQWLLIGALVKRGVAFIGDNQPCSGHDIVLLGLLVDRATHAAILQGALPGQFPLLLCRRTWEGSCVLPLRPPCLTTQGSLGWASTVKPLALRRTEAGIPTPGPCCFVELVPGPAQPEADSRGQKEEAVPCFPGTTTPMLG